MSFEEAVEYLKGCCKDSNGIAPISFGGFYCGITNNVDRREGEHNTDYLGYVNCKTFEVAKRLEARMHDEGFDTGDQLGHGQEDSRYVYVYKKNVNTKE